MSWKHSVLACFDVETTGTCPMSDDIVELAVVVARMVAPGEDLLEELGSYSTLVDPGRPIPEDVRKVHGISDLDVLSAPRIGKAVANLLTTIVKACPGGHVQPVAYNAAFDRAFLGRPVFQAYRDAKQQPPAWVYEVFSSQSLWLDPLPWARHMFRREKGGNKLEMTAARLKIDGTGRGHRALDDARTALRCTTVLAAAMPDDLQLAMCRQRQLKSLRDASYWGDYRAYERAKALYPEDIVSLSWDDG